MSDRLPKSIYFFALFYLGGVMLCGYLYLMDINQASGLCDLLGSDCLSVVSSGYGKAFTLPVAALGAGYFGSMFFLFVLLLYWGRPLWLFFMRTLFVLHCLALAISLYFIYLMQFKLHAFCAGCYAVHILNLLTFLLSLFLLPLVKKRRGIYAGAKDNRGRETSISLFAALLFGCLIIAGMQIGAISQKLNHERQKISENIHHFRYLYEAAAKHEFAAADDDLLYGDPVIANHEIVLIYKDDCPYCKDARRIFEAMVDKNQLAVSLRLKKLTAFSAEELENLGIKGVPAVFIDGKRAAGWSIPEFRQEFGEDCGC